MESATHLVATSSLAPPRRTQPRPQTRPAPKIWAIGGGKGGVGKSVVASSLAVAFAKRGRRTVLIDADFGGANLHSFFGGTVPKRTLTDFFDKRIASLREAAAQTALRNLWLVSGAKALPGAANLPHYQKQKFLRHLHMLPADDVLIDLSAGSAFNAIDLFLAADQGLLVVVPEPTSTENAYQFLHAAFFRGLRGVARDPEIRKVIETALAACGRHLLREPRALIAEVRERDPRAGRLLEQAAAAFRPSLIANKVRQPNSLAWEMRANTRRFLGADIRVLGELPWDDDVAFAVQHERPVLDLKPRSSFSLAFDGLVDHHLCPRPAPVETAGQRVRPIATLGPGARFARHRELKRKTRGEVAFHLRIRESLVEAIEAEDFAAFPNGPYLRAWLVEYAKFLDLSDGDRLATRYLARLKTAPDATH